MSNLYCLKVDPVNTSKNQQTEIMTWNCSNQLFVFVNNEKLIL